MNQDELIGTMWIGPTDSYLHSLVLILKVDNEDYYTNKSYYVLRCGKFEHEVFFPQEKSLIEEGWTRIL